MISWAELLNGQINSSFINGMELIKYLSPNFVQANKKMQCKNHKHYFFAQIYFPMGEGLFCFIVLYQKYKK